MVGKHLTRQCNSVQVMCVVAMVWLYQCILVFHIGKCMGT